MIGQCCDMSLRSVRHVWSLQCRHGVDVQSREICVVKEGNTARMRLPDAQLRKMIPKPPHRIAFATPISAIVTST
jgi:hypothetical protein